jgi:hypothetical protein
MATLWEYISAGVVEYTYFKGWHHHSTFPGTMQHWAYNSCIHK